MERSSSFEEENFEDFSKPIAELNIKEIEKKYSIKYKNHNNNNNKNVYYCDENSIDQIYLNNNKNQIDLQYIEEPNSDLYNSYEPKRRVSKSSGKRKVSNKHISFNFNFSSGNSNIDSKSNNNRFNLSKDIKEFYCNKSDVIAG